MLRSLRQVALITRDLEESLRFWSAAFGIEACYRDDLSDFGLSNVLLPIGDQFLELLQVEDAGSSGARFLARHGEGLYMVIFDGSEIPALAERVAEREIPIVHRINRPGWQGIHLHPKALNGVLISVEDGFEPGRWPAAGEDWRPHVRTDVIGGVRGAGLLTDDAERDFAAWSALFDLRVERDWVQDGLRILNAPIGDGATFIEFQQPVEPDAPAARRLAAHGPGLFYWALTTPNLDAALTRVREHGVSVIRSEANVGGGRSAWLHPRTTGGVLTELIEP